MKKIVEVYDIETLKSAFTYTSIDIKTKEIYKFVIHESKTDLHKLISHLTFTVGGQIGFNNLAFDYPIIHYIYTNYKYWITYNNQEIIELIYQKAQDIISAQNNDEILAHRVPEKSILIPQLDLYKIWHYNNKAKATSLKSLQISMNYPNVVDMPISHTKEDITVSELEDILYYNLNDVLSTYEFYLKSIEKIELRKMIRNQYNLPCLNWNNGKIGEQLILKLYCEATGKDPRIINKLRTHRESIDLASCVPKNVDFITDKFKTVEQYIKRKIITTTKNAINMSIYEKGIKIVYGTGGIHGCIKPGVYESDNDYIIKSCDVSSLYPSLAIVLGLYPEHLGKEFLDVYKKNIVDVRLAEKAKGKDANKVIVDGFKEAANIPYGKSNEETSFLYDPLYTMKTTIAGQLYLSMLVERLMTIEGSQVLMVNTDGLEIRIPRQRERSYHYICDKWQHETGLQLEFMDYQKMWISDVNTYGALTMSGKVKNKGRFEVDKKLGNEPAYHKDNSFRIIPLAIEEYFTKNIPIEETIKNHDNIYDFCGRQRFRGNDKGILRSVIKGQFITEETQKNTRYYINNGYSMFVKKYAKGDSELIHKGNSVKIFNNYIELPMNEYNIKYDFYVKECRKEIDNIVKKQLNLML